MKNISKRKELKLQILLFAIIAISLISCGGGEMRNESGNAAPLEKTNNESEESAIIDSILASQNPPIELEDYKVVLGADENLKMGETGELRVWIGSTGLNISFSDGMAQDETTIPANIGQYAKITPYAPDFKVSPTEIACVRIHLSGSDVRFSLKFIKSGSLKVSVNIELYDNVDCIGTSVLKTAATLSVIVEVDNKKLFMGKLQEMGDIVWDKFLTFWGALIALLFGVLLFLIRRKIKKKTGFDDKEKQ